MKEWKTLYTKFNNEYRVAVALEEQHGLEAYLPQIEMLDSKQSYKKEPLFPCYLFVKVDLEKVPLSVFESIPGLRHFVHFGGQPITVPETVIDIIQSGLAKLSPTTSTTPSPFKPGEPVKIVEGPFKGMEAIFEGPATPDTRVQVLLEVLGSLNRVEVDTADLADASSGEPEVTRAKRPRRTRGRGRRIKQK
jgi:transcriptional antiterminator RfaH